MMRARVAGLLMVAGMGCTHRQELAANGSDLEVGQVVEARTNAGAEVEGIVVKGPLGGYRVRVAAPRQELELDQVTTISRRSSGRGALDGLLIGAATGALFGGVVGAAAYDEDEPPIVGPESLEGSILLGAAAWAGIGGLVGAIGGAVSQATIEYTRSAARP